MPIAFNQIPSNLRPPGVFVEFDPSQANNLEQDRKSAITGQMLPSGSRALSVQTSAATTANGSNATLTFASSTVIAALKPGSHVYALDRTAPNAIAQGVTVLSKSGGVVTLSEPIANNVGSGDTIEFDDCTPALVNSQNQVNLLFGRGSQIAIMYGYYRNRDNFGELWAAPFPDDPAGVAATNTLTVAGTVTQTADIFLYAFGVLCATTVTPAMSSSQIATALAASINAGIDPVTGSLLPGTASASGAVVTTTARNAGLFGNDLDMRLNYLGPASGEQTPAGLTITISPFASGAQNATTGLTNALNGLPPYYWGQVAHPYSDSASLNAVQAWENDVTGQWAWSNMHYGAAFGWINGTLGALQTAGVARNDQHGSLMGMEGCVTPPFAAAAVFAADVAAVLRANPANSLDATVLTGVKAPRPTDRFDISDQNTLLWSGISTYDVDPDGTVRINKAITTYQTNSSGDPDDSYLDVELLYKASFCMLDLRADLQSKYTGANLVADGTRIGPGQKFITPSIAAAEVVSRYGVQMDMGLVEDIDGFEAALLVEINDANSDRLDILWPGAIVKNLDIIAILAQFRNGVLGS